MDIGNSRGVNNEFMVKCVCGLVRVSCIFMSTSFIVLMRTVYEKITYPAFSPSLLHTADISFVQYLSKGLLIHLGNTAILHSILADFEWKLVLLINNNKKRSGVPL